MIIDAHNHPDWHGHDLGRFLENMEMNDIDVTWLLTWIAPESEYAGSYGGVLPTMLYKGPVPFERALYYKEKYPEKFVLGYCPDPREPDAISKLRSAVKIYGVKVCGELKLRMMYDNPDAIRFFRECGELGLPVTVHLDYEFDNVENHPWSNFWYGGGIDAFERAVAACPDTIFMGHAPGFWAHISGDDKFDKTPYPDGPVLPGGRLIEIFDKYDNVYGDLSAGSGCNALSRDPGHALMFIEKYQDRLVYARDYFDDRHRKFIDSLKLSGEVRDKIYYKNALKLVPLD
ncbi:MAG TPA: amidohydrolase family protein [Clostridia bacterium]|nr:amidohydrolase family protein [Clostridia bacterium]HRX42311.1 amidohydrolase family protein [Clostridia bacterium]